MSIYLGIFLSLLLIVIALGMPFTQRPSFSNILMYWPHTFRKAWQNSKISSNILSLLAMMIILLALFVLLRPYAMAVDLYGFSRSWGKVYPMIPRIQSYFIADGVTLWQPFASFTAKITDHRWEHQLFIGIPAVILLVAGFIWQFRSPHRKLAFLFIGATAVLVLLTLNVKGFTLYKFLWPLPGFSSLRAVTRIILVLMWPIALFISIEADALLRIPSRSVIFTTIVLLLLALMAAESIFYNHTTFSKADAQARIQTLKEQLPTTFPEDPVLYVWDANDTGPSYSEVDAMLLSQDLGWPTVNGYSGNAPNGSGLVDNCDDISTRIKGYMNFAKITDPSFYNDLLSRVAPISPQKCTWYKPVP